MKLRKISALVSSAMIAGGIAAVPSMADTNTTTTVPAGGAVVTVKTPDAGGDMGDQNMVSYMGMSGMWVEGVDEPVIPGIVISEDNLADRALVKTPYGYTSVRTGAGTSVLYNDHLMNWLKVAPGAVVQLPMSEVVSGPVPHRLSSGMMYTPGYMPGDQMMDSSEGGMSGGMNGGMGSTSGDTGMGGSSGGRGRHHHRGGSGTTGGDMSGTTGGTTTGGTQ